MKTKWVVTFAAVFAVLVVTAASGANDTSQFAGVWLFQNDQLMIKTNFTRDGRFTRVMKSADGEERTAGKFSVSGRIMVVRPDGEDEVVRLNYRFVDSNQLELLDDEGSGIRLVKQEPPKPVKFTACNPNTTKAKKSAKSPSTCPPPKNAPSKQKKPTASKPGKHPTTVVFRRFAEPREKAFTALMPKGWKVDGGILRLPPDLVGAHNATGAKADITLKRDASGSLQMRWLPDLLYLDTRGQAYEGFTQIGGVFNNVIVLPKLGAEGYLLQVIVPRVIPEAQNVQVISQKKLPKLAQLYAAPLSALPGQVRQSITCDATMVTIGFEENGKPFKARLVTAVQDFGPIAPGLWQGMGTSLYRAPAAEFEAWLPVLSVIQGSVKWNLKWLAAELRASAGRREFVGATEADLRRMDAEIVNSRQKVNSEINKSMYLNLTSQAEYKNPFTGEKEIGSNEWNRRWQNSAGEVIYTDDTAYNPNADPNLGRQGFKLTRGR